MYVWHYLLNMVRKGNVDLNKTDGAYINDLNQ